MLLDNDEAAGACRLYAAEYRAKAKNALLPTERERLAEIAERFVVMAAAYELLDESQCCSDGMLVEGLAPERRLN
jgi:hypothetical protein